MTPLSLSRRLAAAAFILFYAFCAFAWNAAAQSTDITKRLEGFDAYMAKTLKNWNAPGVGVGIVVNDKLVFAKGYGFRDYEKKLPFTPATMSPIASNTKLFTAIAAGMLVEEGKLTWDKPVRESVPAIRFYNDQLNNTVTLRDMLSHRTGITRHDTIWYKSDFTRKELFEKLVYLEPQQPMRETFLYNNLMFAAVGYLIELQSGKTWEQFVKERIFDPLQMNSTSYSIADMLKRPEFGVGFTETARFLRHLPDSILRRHIGRGSLRSHRLQYRGYVSLVDRADEPGQIQRQAGASGGSVKGHSTAGHRPAKHDARNQGMV